MFADQWGRGLWLQFNDATKTWGLVDMASEDTHDTGLARELARVRDEGLTLAAEHAALLVQRDKAWGENDRLTAARDSLMQDLGLVSGELARVKDANAILSASNAALLAGLDRAKRLGYVALGLALTSWALTAWRWWL